MEKTIAHSSIDTTATLNEFKFYKKIVLGILGKMNEGRLNLILPDGEILVLGNNNKITAALRINNPEFFRKVVLFGDIGFGESYVDGDWDTDDLTNVISWLILNIENNPAISGTSQKFSPISWLKSLNRIYHKFNSNTKSGSRKNISNHYDLNNDFFKLWLDESMSYSSALFKDESTSLYDAQIEKYDRICRELKIKDTDSVLEIGTGWGGFCTHAAKNYGCNVTTVTISQEQYKYSTDLVKSLGLEDKIKVLLCDYREISGSYDKIVSIEMLEAVGHEFLPAYFAKINEVLKKDGSAALQVITSHDSNYDKLRKGVDWIQKHIFPGSLLPSIGAINNAVNKTGNLYLHDLKNFGLDYARTLRTWRHRFNDNLESIYKLNFDNEFVRKWNYYLCYCEAAFAMRNINVVQMIYTRPNNRNL